jgi:hypothetical protein
MMKKLCGGLFVLGLLILLGTAGASDMEMISASSETFRLLIGISMVAVGFIKGRLWDVG